MTVEGNSLEIRNQIFFGGGFRTLVSDLPGQLVQLGASLGDLPSSVDHGHSCLKGAST